MHTTPTHATYTVTGMSCGHCVASVREEIDAVEGVEAVDVDLASGRLVVTGIGVSEEAVAAATAGYQVIR